ncbi:hypothetical protein JX266_014102 [Neoarthrinium moseri]|nr:hypothetical protein JX266_014102 [Neoarthrinium moseri]
MEQPDGKLRKGEPLGELRLRIKEHILIRRRKVNIPELGPMPTVQEVAMDSPTIPGHPAVYERFSRSPVNIVRQHNMAQLVSAVQHASMENHEVNKPNTVDDPSKSSQEARAQPISPNYPIRLAAPSRNNTQPHLARKPSRSQLQFVSPPGPASSSTRADEPPILCPPPESLISFIIPELTVGYSTSSVPSLARVAMVSYEPSKLWIKPLDNASTAMSLTHHPYHASTAKPKPKVPRSATALSSRPELDRNDMGVSYQRNQSQTASIAERGRLGKRIDDASVGGALHCTWPKNSNSAARRAFEQLPLGWKPIKATSVMQWSEVSHLQKQALGQAMTFKVLSKDDVESLSKELRYLDERSNYLRQTYASLRAGRHKLHSRNCQYLRSARVAKFSYESILEQEAALARLDDSIDEWLSNLEHIENRRSLVRQKLLEHIAAAAATMSLPPNDRGQRVPTSTDGQFRIRMRRLRQSSLHGNGGQGVRAGGPCSAKDVADAGENALDVRLVASASGRATVPSAIAVSLDAGARAAGSTKRASMTGVYVAAGAGAAVVVPGAGRLFLQKSFGPTAAGQDGNTANDEEVKQEMNSYAEADGAPTESRSDWAGN